MSHHLVLVLGALVLVSIQGCSSSKVINPESGEVSSVLEPADATPPVSPAPSSPLYQTVMALLSELGYEGMGLEHEDDTTLQFMITLFNSPKAQNKRIKYVYSGLQLSYDPEQASLTLGEDNNLTKALNFIDKKIPKR